MTSRANIRLIRRPERGDIEVSDDALLLIAACINEALEAVAEWELPIRIGFSIEEVRDVKGQIKSILEERAATARDQ